MDKREKGGGFSLCLWLCTPVRNTSTPWQQHREARWGCFERRREEERLPPFLPRQTCGVAAELSRGHTTHIASAHIYRCADWKSLALPSISPSLYTAYMSMSLLAATCRHSHQSLRLSALLAESMGCPWSRCWYCCSVQGYSHLTAIHCDISTTGQFQGMFVLLSILGWLQCLC